MIPYSRPKHSDLYTLSYSKLLENHTLHSGTYLYSPYMAVPPPGLNPPLVCYKRNVLNKDDLLASTERNKMLHNHPLEKELREYLEQIKALILDDINILDWEPQASLQAHVS